MDSLSELDDCINTLEQLQLTLDFETSTVKRNPNLGTSPPPQRCINVRPNNRIEFAPSQRTFIDQDEYLRETQLQDIPKTSIQSVFDNHDVFDTEKDSPVSQIEMLDFRSVSVQRPKLSSNQSTDSDLFSIPETDSSEFPPPPPPLGGRVSSYPKPYSSQTLQTRRSSNNNSNSLSNQEQLYQTSLRKQSTNSLKLSPKPLVDPFNVSQTSNNDNFHSQSSSQSNISSVTDKEAKSLKSFQDTDAVSTMEDPSKQTVVRFFTTDRTTKAIAVSEDTHVAQIISILMEKHFWIPSLKSAVVEKTPSLKMERFFEEHECLLSCINSWPSSCGNMIFFEPREDVYGLFENAKEFLGDNYSPGSINVDGVKNLFLSLSSEQHEYQDYIYIKKPGENSWKRKFCLLNHHGIFSIQKKKSKSSSPSTVMTFNDRFYLYTSTGGWTKQWDAPTPFGFAFKPYSVVDPKSDQILMFCTGDEVSMKRWCSNLRLCKYKTQILNNYQHMQNRSIYCSNLYSSDCQINRILSMSPLNKPPKYNFSNRSSLPTSSISYGKGSESKFKF